MENICGNNDSGHKTLNNSSISSTTSTHSQPVNFHDSNFSDSNNSITISNSNISLKTSSNAKSNVKSESFKQYPSFISTIIYYISETIFKDILFNKNKIIQKLLKKDHEEYKPFCLFYIALKNIEKKDFNEYRELVYEIDKKFCDIKTSYKNDTELLKYNRFIFEHILFNNIKKIACKKRGITEYNPIVIEDKSEDKIVKKYQEKESEIFEEINELLALFYTKHIKCLSSDNYKIVYKFVIHFIIEESPIDDKLTTLEDYFNNYLLKRKEKIYSFPTILRFLFETKNDNIKYNVKYGNEIWLPLYNGEKVGFILDAIIYENDDEYNIRVNESSYEKHWKIFDNKNINDIILSYDLYKPIMLFYKKIEKKLMNKK